MGTTGASSLACKVAQSVTALLGRSPGLLLAWPGYPCQQCISMSLLEHAVPCSFPNEGLEDQCGETVLWTKQWDLS